MPKASRAESRTTDSISGNCYFHGDGANKYYMAGARRRRLGGDPRSSTMTQVSAGQGGSLSSRSKPFAEVHCLGVTNRSVARPREADRTPLIHL